MLFSRKLILASAITVQCLVGSLAGSPARAADIPDNFFQEWTVSKNCTEQHAGHIEERAGVVDQEAETGISSDEFGRYYDEERHAKADPQAGDDAGRGGGQFDIAEDVGFRSP